MGEAEEEEEEEEDEEEAKLLLMTSLRFSWLQGVHAKFTGHHIIVCSSDACDLLELRAFAAALEATSVSWCMVAVFGTTTLVVL